MNETEAAILSGRDSASVDTNTDWTAVASDFLDRGVKNVVITLGAQVRHPPAPYHRSAEAMVDAECH